MRYSVTVKPGAKKPGVEITGPASLSVRVDAPPVEGKANRRLIEILSEHFGVSKSRIRIAKGEGSRVKVVEVRA